MGRSRGNFQSEEDPTQRSRRRKHASNGENLESSSSGQVTTDGKKALYHCNYCKKDITGRTRIKCAVCSDFDLCIECFSVGAEVHPHKSSHHYRVMDALSFPLICPDWNADEEMLLLEGLEMYGMWNWAEVGEHVGTKSKEACIEHYRTAYLESPYFPLPDMTHVMGKNRNELLAMAKGQNDEKKGAASLGEVTPKDELLFSPSRVKIEDQYKSGPSGRLPLVPCAGPTAKKKASNKVQIRDQPDSKKPKGKSVDNNKAKISKEEGSSLMELSGFNEKRQDFDPEYDNDAEQLLSDMEFKETDTEEEHEVKLRVLRYYYQRLDERKRRKDFILDRNLLHQSAFMKDLSPEEKTLCKSYEAFMRFLSKEEHDDFLKTLITEHRIQKRIRQLKEAQAAGCHHSTDANKYLDWKRKKETEVNGNGKVGCDNGGNSIGFHDAPVSSDPNDPYSVNLDAVAFSNGVLLSAPEKELCNEMRLAPPEYMKMQSIMTMNIFNGNITKRSDAYSFFQMEPTKVDRVYDMLVKKGIASSF